MSAGILLQSSTVSAPTTSSCCFSECRSMHFHHE